MISAISERWF